MEKQLKEQLAPIVPQAGEQLAEEACQLCFPNVVKMEFPMRSDDTLAVVTRGKRKEA